MRCFLLLIFCSSPLLANPSNGVATSGSVTISEQGKHVDIHASDGSIIHWDSFSIAADELTRFHQGSVNAAVLNRVIGNEMSQLMGKLQADGRIYLINPNGILIGKEGIIDTAGFIASTFDLSDKAFLSKEPLLLEGESVHLIQNFGTIQTASGPAVLLAHRVENSGIIDGEHISLGSGHKFYLQTDGQTELLISPDITSEGISNEGIIKGLTIQLQSDGTSALAINQKGICQANRVEEKGGKIFLRAEGTIHLGNDSVTEADNGSITVNGRKIYHFGAMKLAGEKSETIKIDGDYLYQAGGIESSKDISIATSKGYTGTSSSRIVAAKGGTIILQGNSHLFTSGTVDASGENGGSIEIGAKNVSLYAAHIFANGKKEAGTIYIGGKDKGTESYSDTLHINHSTIIEANSQTSLKSGKVIAWSDELTVFQGNISARDGFVEISGKELCSAGEVDANELLLDPENVLINAALGTYPNYQFVDPDAGNGSGFGSDILVLSSGNVAVTKPNGGTGGEGAVYLFDGASGALVNGVVGMLAGDNVGSGGLITVGGGANYVIASPAWSTNFGAATFVNGSSGLSATIDSSNSLVGSSSGDLISNDGITLLQNGNYVVASSTWNSNAGAVTFGSGSSGVSGVVSSSNSLVGNTGDFVGSGGVTALTNGNYVVSSPSWDSVNLFGAATWGDGTLGTSGVVSFGNSIIGGTANDQISSGGITALTNGHYVISSPLFDDIASDVGAATWASGNFATMAIVDSSNSIIGSTANDQVSSGGITALSNNNYVIASPLWDDGATTDAGAATWADGSSSTSDVVSNANSIIGSLASDQVSSGGITALNNNGNYVVSSPAWNGNIGAATWADGSVAAMFIVGGGNSLIGSIAGDQVSSGGITALNTSNGDYVVSSPAVDIGANNMAGAATWGDGTSGVIGAVTPANSLVGSAPNEMVSSSGVTALTNGNYVVSSPFWNANAGAATFADGTTGITGAINPGNSLVGGAGDSVAFDGTTALTNGNYVVVSSQWTGGLGAVTLGDGTLGILGAVSAANSLVGVGGGDQVGSGGVTAFSGGAYAVSSPDFDGVGANSGAATFATSSGVVGAVSQANSLFGFAAGSGLSTIVEDSINNTFISPFLTESTGIVRAGLTQPDQISSTTAIGQTLAISPDFIEAQLLNGTTLNIEATSDITISNPITVSALAPAGTSLNITAGNDLFIDADITGEAVSLNFTAGQNLTLDNNALVETDSGNILLIAGQDIIGITPVTIQTTGTTSTLTLVADNAFPSSPDFGTGIINLTSDSVVCTNGCIGGGDLQLYTSIIGANSFPSMMNMTPVPGAFENFGVYFPDGIGGLPFQIFYKASLLGSFVDAVEVFSTSINETFSDTVDEEEETGQGTVRNPDGISTTNPAPCS